MIKIFFIFLALSLFITCSKEEKAVNQSSSIVSVNGTIYNWTLGTGYKISICQFDTRTFNYTKLDSSTIDNNGNFDIKLTSVPLLQTINLGDSFVVSNNAAKMSSGMLWLKVFNSEGILIGRVFYGLEATPNSGPEAGDVGIGYFYVDQNVKITSTTKNSTIDITLSSGWNKFVQRYLTDTKSISTTDFSENNLSGAKWTFVYN